MFSRRKFLNRIVAGSALASALPNLATSESFASPAAPAMAEETPARNDDWMKESRWGRENWKVTHQTIEWPNKARVAFLCSIPFESYDMGEYPGDNSATVSEVLYGGKAGVWRIMNILDRHSVKGNFVTNALCAVQFPELVKTLADHGHEIVGHFWANNIPEDKLSVDRDRALIRRSISTIEKVTGKKPVAWVAPGWWAGPQTLEILAEEGLTSHANSPSSADVPFAVTIGGKKIVVVVQETVLNDNGFFNNFNSPATYVEYLKRDFDRKYSEGAMSGKLFNFVLHAHVSGRPYFADALDEVISYVKSFPDVWFTTRQPLVDWWLQKNYR